MFDIFYWLWALKMKNYSAKRRIENYFYLLLIYFLQLQPGLQPVQSLNMNNYSQLSTTLSK